jgi:hypothetical protein
MSVGTFTVSSALYDGSYATPQPGQTQADQVVCIQGTVTGFNGWFPNLGVVSNFTFKFVVYLYWNSIQNANLAGGTAAVQNLIAIAVQNFWLQTPIPLPTFPAGNVPAPTTGSTIVVSTSCTQALVGSWSQ